MSEACRRCGSEKIIPSVPLMDHYGDLGGFSDPARVSVSGQPDAWFFRDTATGRLRARICGECGYVELHASNFRMLYEKYLKARGEATAPKVETAAPQVEAVPPGDEAPVEPVAEGACLSCGQMIPPTASRCPACGWSWESPAAEPT
jgi:hypothetical protein